MRDNPVVSNDHAALWWNSSRYTSSQYAVGSLQLLVTSTPYPGMAGFDISVEDYLSWWWLEQVACWVPKLDPITGVFVQNVQFGRRDEWFDWRSFDMRHLFLSVGLHPINVYMWDKLNASPAGGNNYDYNEWEFVFALAFTPLYKFHEWREPYADKTVSKAKGKMRKSDVRGGHAGGHGRLHPDGARQSDVLRLSNATSGRPRVEGGVFPEKLARRMIYQYSDPGDWVIDPFCGSGTVLAEGLRQRRNVIGSDISQTAVATSQRWIRDTIAGLDDVDKWNEGRGLPGTDERDLFSRSN